MSIVQTKGQHAFAALERRKRRQHHERGLDRHDAAEYFDIIL